MGEHRQFGLSRAIQAEAEHAIAKRHVADTGAELVDDPGCLVAQRLRELLIHQSLALFQSLAFTPAARILSWPGWDAASRLGDPAPRGRQMR